MKERFVFLHKKEDLSEKDIIRRNTWFDEFPKLKQAYDLKEGLGTIYKEMYIDDAL